MVVKKLVLNLILALLLAFVGLSFIQADEAEAALVFHSGFENGNTFEWTSVTGTPAANSIIKNTGSYSLRGNATSGTAYVTVVATVKRFSFYFYRQEAGGFFTTTILGSGSSGGRLDYVFNIPQQIKVYDGATLRGSFAIESGWHRMSGAFGGGSNTDWVSLDGVVQISSVTISDLAANNIGVIVIPVNEALVYFDDIAFDDTFSTTDLGDIRTLLSLPNAAGDLSQFDTPVGNTTAGYHYINVDDAPGSISDADYNWQAASAAAIDIYNLQNSSTIGLTSTETVQAVRTLARMKRGTGGAGGGRAIQIKDNGASTNTSVAATVDFAWYFRDDVTLPNGGGAWTQTRFDALQTGANHGKGTTDAQDTFISALMDMVAFYRVPGDPSSLASPAQTSVSINLTWTKGTQADNTTIRYKTGAYPDNTTDGTLGYADTGTSTQVTGLDAGTTYYFRAWAYATPSGLYSTGTSDLTQATTAGYDISNDPSVLAFGTVLPSTSYYAKGSPPANPVVNDNCTFTLTNNGASTINTTIKATNFTGGAGWTLGAPDGTHARITVYYVGQDPTSGVVLTTSDQAFYNGLVSSGTIKWDFKLDTPTSFADGSIKTSVITITATAG